MDEKDLVEGMREYISLLQKEGRYSSAKSYQDAMNSFIRYSGTEDVYKRQIRALIKRKRYEE